MRDARVAPLAAGLAALLLAAGCAVPPRERAAGAAAQPGLALPRPDTSDPRPALLVVATVAGLQPLHYRGAGGRLPVMPTVAALAEAGVSADAVESVAPATKYPAHATLLTGRLPSAHGIPADLLFGDRGVRDALYWHASHLKAEPLWQLVAQQGRSVAALGWPSTLGASIPLLLPDLAPVREGDSWLEAVSDATTPAVLDLLREAGGAEPAAGQTGPTRDAVLARVACRLLVAPVPPSLLLVHLSQTEKAIARYGPDSREADAAFASADREIAGLLSCLDSVGRLASSALAVLGDHGTAAIHTLVSPNAVLASEGLLRTGNGLAPGVASWSALSRSNGGSAFVYARSDAAAVRARRSLATAAEETGAFRVVSAKEMLSLGADPDAWFGLEALPGFAFGDSPYAPVVQPAARRGVGGYLPDGSAMDAGFVGWGRGFRDGIRVPRMRQTDVAPTLARLLGVKLSGADGRALVGILAPSRGP